MKTVLFFHRCELTKLYVLLAGNLRGKLNIIHVAYSQEEIKILEKAGITNYIDYQKEFLKTLDNLKPTKELIKEIDEIIISQSQGQFSLNSSIQSDRGYALLDYKEAILLACCHYVLWSNIFKKQHVDLMYHELVSQFMNHIAAIICKSQGGEYIYQTQLRGDNDDYYYLNIDGENFSCKELEDNYKYYCNHPKEIDIERCKLYIDKFRSDYNVAFGDLVKPVTNRGNLFFEKVKHTIYRIMYAKKYDRLKNNIDYWMIRNNVPAQKLNNIRQYKKKNIMFSQPVLGEKYFYFSIHLEPEAVVLYQGSGIYTNQIKLIENIAASLPAGYYLYVKDHPHEYAYRNADDYERLMKVPNIRLIDRRIPGKLLIKNAIGVFSIAGTAGFEGLLLAKQSYCFGNTYYSITPRVNYIENVKDLRGVVYRNMLRSYDDDTELYVYVYSYLKSLHKGFVTYFGNDRISKTGINETENSKRISEEILVYSTKG